MSNLRAYEKLAHVHVSKAATHRQSLHRCFMPRHIVDSAIETNPIIGLYHARRLFVNAQNSSLLGEGFARPVGFTRESSFVQGSERNAGDAQSGHLITRFFLFCSDEQTPPPLKREGIWGKVAKQANKDDGMALRAEVCRLIFFRCRAILAEGADSAFDFVTTHASGATIEIEEGKYEAAINHS